MSQRVVDAWVRKFRILKGWTVRYDRYAVYKAQCVKDTKHKRATIYAFGKRPTPEDYYYHEVLHLAIAAFDATVGYPARREAEEKLIQDLCRVWRKKKT